MKTDAIAFGVAGIVFGLLAGWVIGAKQAELRPPVDHPAQEQAAAQPSDTAAPPAAVLDQSKVTAFRNVADKEPSNSEARIQLGNLYYDAGQYNDAIKWYEEAAKLSPRDVNLLTDLGVCYYNVNQPDKALDEFNRSLKIDPKHTKTLLNVGVVKAFAKQDLQGALEAWQQVVQIAPDSPEARQAQQGIDGIKSAHPGGVPGAKPGN